MLTIAHPFNRMSLDRHARHTVAVDLGSALVLAPLLGIGFGLVKSCATAVVVPLPPLVLGGGQQVLDQIFFFILVFPIQKFYRKENIQSEGGNKLRCKN